MEQPEQETTSAPSDDRPVLVLGATGYIGRRLVTELVAAGHRVRALVRNPAKLDAEEWSGILQRMPGLAEGVHRESQPVLGLGMPVAHCDL